MESSLSATTAIQLVSVVVFASIVVTVGVVWRVRKNLHPVVIPLLVPPVLWALFGVIFYYFLLTGRLTSSAVLFWGAIHRLLSALLIWIAVLVVLILCYESGSIGFDDRIEDEDADLDFKEWMDNDAG